MLEKSREKYPINFFPCHYCLAPGLNILLILKVSKIVDAQI